MKALLPLLLLCLLPLAAFGAYDVRVIDGDTVNVPMGTVVNMPSRVSVRLIGVNAPETRQAACDRERAAGEAAKVYVRDRFATATRVKIEFVRWDKYGGRVDGRITLDGKDLATDLVAAGFAAPYSGGVRVNVWCPKQ